MPRPHPHLPHLPRPRLPRLLRPRLGAPQIAVVLLLAAIGATRTLRGLDAVEVAGDSMSPELQPGDFVLLRRGSPPPGAPIAALAGMVVAAEPPGLAPAAGDPATTDAGPAPLPASLPALLLKRIVAGPGESVRAGSGVQINGRLLDEPYAHGITPAEQYRGVAALGPDDFFLLGDHRARSTDSRTFGAVRREMIRGQAIARYWPPSRWGRIGHPRRAYKAD